VGANGKHGFADQVTRRPTRVRVEQIAVKGPHSSGAGEVGRAEKIEMKETEPCPNPRSRAQPLEITAGQGVGDVNGKLVAVGEVGLLDFSGIRHRVGGVWVVQEVERSIAGGPGVEP